MNLKRGFKRLTFLLSIIAFCFCGLVGFAVVQDKISCAKESYQYSLNNLKSNKPYYTNEDVNQNLKEWENLENNRYFLYTGIPILSSLIGFAVVWIIYLILYWIISGFE